MQLYFALISEDTGAINFLIGLKNIHISNKKLNFGVKKSGVCEKYSYSEMNVLLNTN